MGKNKTQSGQGDDGVGVEVGMLRGVRRSRPRPTRFPKSQHRRGKDDAIKNEEDDLDEKDGIEMSPSEIYRNRVLASVGLDDDDDEDIHVTESHRRDRKQSGRRRKDNDVESTDVVEEDGTNSAEEDDELLEDDESEYESFQQSNENESSWRAAVKRIIRKILWIMVAVAALVYIFYDDEMLEESEIDEDVIEKEPFSYNGYKDARIPDDDIAQYGGGLIGAEVFGMGENNTEIEDEDNEQLQNQQDTHHEHTGIFQIDSLWEQLNGFIEMAEPYDAQRELPVFWHVPKSGGTTLQDLLMHCVGMVGANEIGGKYAKDTGPLEIVQLENGNRYVNVDMSSPGGITHAKDMGFGQSGLANVVMTSWFDQTASVFDDDNKGRCFTLLRHPIRRAVSMFYYLKDATWEHTYSEVYKSMTIEEYAVSQYAEDNWMVRFLTNEMSGVVYERHIDLAKQVLESKCIVGLMEEFTPSFKRFNEYFGWSNHEFGGPVTMSNRGTCVSRVIRNPDNAHTHPTFEEGTEVWNLLMQKNQYDMILYDHAVHLFHEVQNELVS